jgi:hypothetical protein
MVRDSWIVPDTLRRSVAAMAFSAALTIVFIGFCSAFLTAF